MGTMSGDPTGGPPRRRFFRPELQGAPLIKPADEETTFTDGKKLLSRLQQPPFDSNGWAFRGQANERWGLEHSLERMYTQYLASEVKVEEFVIAEFMRRAHHYTPIPPADDMGEWLALIRHHGAPTRLLDWTRSPYIAAYFAAPDSKMGDTSAIWAIDLLAIKKAVAAVFDSSHGAAQTNVPLELPSLDRFMKFEDPTRNPS